MRRHKKRRGQVLVFYALMIPIFLLAGGVGLDLGWYYLNVSRLQNAADAAVVAGARIFVKNQDEDAFKDVDRYLLINNRLFDENREYIATSENEKQTIADAKSVSEDYAVKNLGSVSDSNIIDSWSKSKAETDKKVDITTTLYDYGTSLYYVVTLTENIEHFFLPGWFDDMQAPVKAVVSLSQITLEDTKNKNVIVGNWEVQDIYFNNKQGLKDGKAEYKSRFGYDLYTGKWNQYQDKNHHYKAGDHRRTETVSVKPNNTGNNSGNSYKTSANGSKIYSEQEVDSLNIDARQDVMFTLGSKYRSEDWDLDLEDAYDSLDQLIAASGYKKGDAANYMRIHTMINFDEPHKAREGKDDPDILWVRIESDAMLTNPDSPNGETTSYVAKSGLRSFNSVHQFIINMNSANTAIDADGKDIYRPVIIFYDGPERYSTANNIRDSLPVIVNLNADFQGVLYVPNSPVVLNDNGYDFNGFIVAKSYMKLKPEEGFYKDEETGKYYDSEAKTTEYFKVSETKNGVTNVLFTDEWGNVQYSEQADTRRLVGTYDNFNRTDFSTHGYKILQSSADNLLLSGN